MRGLRGDESSEIGHVVKPVRNLRWRDRKLKCDDVKKTTAKVKDDRKTFKSGQMFYFGIQKYRLIASVTCTARVAAKDDLPQGQKSTSFMYICLCSSSGRFFFLNGPVGKR
jgi:hypothetical protein